MQQYQRLVQGAAQKVRARLARRRSDTATTPAALEKRIRDAQDTLKIIDTASAELNSTRASLKKGRKYAARAASLFLEISENISVEYAVWTFRLISKQEKRGKAYGPFTEQGLLTSAQLLGNTYEASKFAHETLGIGNSVVAVQRHIQRLMKSGDKKPKGKSRDK
jgi:hypothetical protein